MEKVVSYTCADLTILRCNVTARILPRDYVPIAGQIPITAVYLYLILEGLH